MDEHLTPAGRRPAETGNARRVVSRRPWGWAVFPILGVLAALTAEAIAHAQATRGFQPMWVPTLVPAKVGYVVMPWSMQIWTYLIVTVTLGLVAVSVLVHSLVTERLWWLRAVLFWAGALLVGVCAVGAAQVGEWWLNLELFGGRGGLHLRTFALPALQEAARWGLLWGWLPALCAAAIRSARPRRRWIGAIVGVAFVAAAIGAGFGLAHSTYGAAVSAQSGVAQPAPQREAPPPVPMTAATAEPEFPWRCAEDAVTVSLMGIDGATGARFLSLEARNTSTQACELRGLPDIAFVDAEQRLVEPEISAAERTATGVSIEETGVEIAPGEAVVAGLTWRAPTGRPQRLTVLMAPWPGAERTASQATIDIVDGVEMELTPWYSRDAQW